MTIAAPPQTVPSKTVASIRWLAAPTSWSWVEQANSRPMEVLIDHAHCERKAAGAAVQMMFRYLCEPGLGRPSALWRGKSWSTSSRFWL